jgi:hypothetical protein
MASTSPEAKNYVEFEKENNRLLRCLRLEENKPLLSLLVDQKVHPIRALSTLSTLSTLSILASVYSHSSQLFSFPFERESSNGRLLRFWSHKM